ncbi:hypothetical protein V6N13_128423 [Hibiscus sabdariffa]
MVWNDVRSNIIWSIGSGHDIDFWRDVWIEEVGPLISHVDTRFVHQCVVSVAQMVSAAGEWRWELFDYLLPRGVLLRIAAVHIPCPSLETDMVGWKGAKDLRFSIKSAYTLRELLSVAGDRWNVMCRLRRVAVRCKLQRPRLLL